MPRCGCDQVAQAPFRLLQLALAPIQHRRKIAPLVVLRVDRESLRYSGPGFLQAMGLFRQHRPADPAIDVPWSGRGGLQEKSAGLFRPARRLILVPRHVDQFGVLRVQFDGFAPGVVAKSIWRDLKAVVPHSYQTTADPGQSRVNFW